MTTVHEERDQTTGDEVPDLRPSQLTTFVNGEQRQQATLDDLIFPVEDLIAYISTFTPLVPGDIISTGTPQGVGFTRKPPIWLKPGDVVEIEVEGIGVLRNPVVAEADLPS